MERDPIKNLFKMADEKFPDGHSLRKLEFQITEEGIVSGSGTFMANQVVFFGSRTQTFELVSCALSYVECFMNEKGLLDILNFFCKKAYHMEYAKKMPFTRLVCDEVNSKISVEFVIGNKKAKYEMKYTLGIAKSITERLERLQMNAPTVPLNGGNFVCQLAKV